MTTRIFGYLRFSYLGRSDVKLVRAVDDPDERAAQLYAPARMAERFYFFERLCLPSLRWQSDPDFRFAIFASPEMPEPYRLRLAALTADLPQVEVVYSSAPHITEAINPWIAAQDSVTRARTVHFRLDDDDALASDTVAVLRRWMDRVPDGCILSRPAGLFLTAGPSGPELLAKFEPNIAIGYALVNPAGHIQNPYQLQHGAHFRIAPCLSLPEGLGYIHTAHGSSDTRAAQWRKLRQAREGHRLLFGSRSRRFQQAVRRAFAGHRPEHFLAIAAAAPGANGGAEAGPAITASPETHPPPARRHRGGK